MICWAGQLPPPPSTASRSDKEAKHGPNQKRKFLEKYKLNPKTKLERCMQYRLGVTLIRKGPWGMS